MARVFVYQYLGDSRLRDRVPDPNDEIPVPTAGDMIDRRGQQWIVDLVTTINIVSGGVSLPEYVVDLRPGS